MHRDRKYLVQLLLLDNEDVDEDVGDRHHYVLIRDLGVLLCTSTNDRHKHFAMPILPVSLHSRVHFGETYSRL